MARPGVTRDVLPDAESVAREGARRIAEAARADVAERGAFHVALSGGRTPWRMLEILAGEALPWEHIHWFQVDERCAPDGDPDRNWTRFEASLLGTRTVPSENLHPMPVATGGPAAAAEAYERTLRSVVGSPPALDLVHLGLGDDGHTASLVPGDAILEVGDRDVAATARPYQGRTRLSLTYPALARARRILWVVTGESKRDALARLERGDAGIPAGRVRPDRARLLADRAAAGD
jgi:6-phosphogluconolactonase